MSLGVLNNISALYAENNLNQTQSSLQNTLTQLSSGSRINSGSDDAAGLSLSNGLEASSTALSQSASNASEGVDFLSVADGALSQVTSLLNRAVTLATEASNGTLNSSQEAATQSEYSSIMTEVSTINGNTEYNGINVFSDAANVYTSDGTVSQSYATSALGSTSSDSLSLGSAVYTSGTVAAATADQVGKTDSYGNAIAAKDNVLSSTDSSGNAVTIDLTAMGDTTTGLGALSNSNAVSISGNKAVAGQILQTTANSATGADQYGATVGAGNYVFTATSNGTTTYTKGTVAAATDDQVGTKDSSGNTIASGDNVLATTDSNGNAITFDLTAMGDTTTTGALSNTNAVAITGNKAVAGAIAQTTGTPATGSVDQYGTTVVTGDNVFTSSSTAVYTSGKVAAAIAAGTDSNGNTVAMGDNVLSTVDSNGNALTLDLTKMGDTTTAVGALSTKTAVAVTGNAATSGSVEKATTATATGNDAYGNAVAAGDYVFTTAADTDTGSGTYNLGTTNPTAGSIYTSGKVAAATATGTDSNGNNIAVGDNVLSTLDASGKSITLDLTAMGDTTTAVGNLSDTVAVAVNGNQAVAGSVTTQATAGTDSFGNAIAANDYVFTATASTDKLDIGATDPGAASTVYTAGAVAAATAGQVGSTIGGKTVVAGDNILTAKDSTGATITLDLTQMGDTTTGVGSLSDGAAVLVKGTGATATATAGVVQQVATTPSSGTDARGSAVVAGDYVFTTTADTYTGANTYSLGTSDPGKATEGINVSTFAVSTAGPIAGNAAAFVAGTTSGTGTYDFGAKAPSSGAFAATDTGAGAIQLGSADPSKAANATYAGTALDSTAEAKVALDAITSAISQVASIRGTEGAEVNTLTAVENVQTTQSTNTTSAENDVMSTDYASATSNLSKYEILEQTGISALAQANSTEQLVTKLLQ